MLVTDMQQPLTFLEGGKEVGIGGSRVIGSWAMPTSLESGCEEPCLLQEECYVLGQWQGAIRDIEAKKWPDVCLRETPRQPGGGQI